MCALSGYKYGFHVTSSNNNKILLTLNARSEHDRSRFVDDLKEAILEVTSLCCGTSGTFVKEMADIVVWKPNPQQG